MRFSGVSRAAVSGRRIYFWCRIPDEGTYDSINMGWIVLHFLRQRSDICFLCFYHHYFVFVLYNKKRIHKKRVCILCSVSEPTAEADHAFSLCASVPIRPHFNLNIKYAQGTCC